MLNTTNGAIKSWFQPEIISGDSHFIWIPQKKISRFFITQYATCKTTKSMCTNETYCRLNNRGTLLSMR